MTVPAPFESAWRDFDRLLRDARDEAGLVTINQAYTMVEGVLRVFRRRLTLAEGIRFADTLPPLARALFVADWDTAAAPVPFGDRVAMASEVHDLRPDHNWAPDTAIHEVAWAMRRHVFRRSEFNAVLASLPEGAAQFWDPELRP
jgi:uncharacterized protein (DUF2267 family)